LTCEGLLCAGASGLCGLQMLSKKKKNSVICSIRGSTQAFEQYFFIIWMKSTWTISFFINGFFSVNSKNSAYAYVSKTFPIFISFLKDLIVVLHFNP
jgi:hypothetical protein